MESSSEKPYLFSFKITMSCEGCSNAIKRILGKETSKSFNQNNGFIYVYSN